MKIQAFIRKKSKKELFFLQSEYIIIIDVRSNRDIKQCMDAL